MKDLIEHKINISNDLMAYLDTLDDSPLGLLEQSKVLDIIAGIEDEITVLTNGYNRITIKYGRRLRETSKSIFYDRSV